MFSRRSFLSTAALGAIGATTLAACSSSGPAKLETAPSGHPTQGATLTYDPNHLVNDGEPITLEWWLWDGDAIFGAFAEAYSAIHTNVEIKIVKQPWEDYWTKLPLALKDSGNPAIFNIHNSYHSNLFPYLEPYDVDIDELSADYTAVDAHVIDGEVYYVDYGLMSGVIYYNTDMWKAAGLTEADIPQTWDELREVAKKLTISEGDSLTQAGFNFNAQFSAFTPGMPYQQGQNLFAEDQATPTFDTEAMAQVVARFQDLYDTDRVGSKDFGTSAGDSFGQGQSAMVYSWTHMGGTLAADFPDLPYATFPTPVPEAGEQPYALDRYNGESTIGINKNADDAAKAVAQDFLKFFLTSEENLKALCLNYHVYPMYAPLSKDSDIAEDPQLSSLAENLDRYIWPGPMPATFEENSTTLWEDILYNGADPADAIAAAQTAIETDLASSEFTAVEDKYKYYQPSH